MLTWCMGVTRGAPRVGAWARGVSGASAREADASASLLARVARVGE